MIIETKEGISVEGILFKIENGKAYFEDGRGYGAEESMGIISGLVNAINTGAVAMSAPQLEEPKNVINYEDILDKRIINGDMSKSTQKLKEWLDNDPEVLAEEIEIEGGDSIG
jgi:hypothetical protein